MMPIDRAQELLQHGVDLCGRGLFWQAHEVWEEVWRQGEGAEKKYIQGLIHLAAAGYHGQHGQQRGAKSQLEKAKSKLVMLPQSMLCVDVQKVWQSVLLVIEENCGDL